MFQFAAVIHHLSYLSWCHQLMHTVSQAPIKWATQAALACCSRQHWAERQHLKMKQGKKEISRNIQGAPELFLIMYLTIFGKVFSFFFFINILLPAMGPGDHSFLAPANQTAQSYPRSVLYAPAGAEMAIACLASVAAQNQTNCLSLSKQEQDVMGFVQPLTDTCTFHSSYSLS